MSLKHDMCTLIEGYVHGSCWKRGATLGRTFSSHGTIRNVVLMIHYMEKFLELGLSELWLRYGTGTKKRFIPIHTLNTKIGYIRHTLLKAHILTGCDITSKVGTKLAALNSLKKGNTEEGG